MRKGTKYITKKDNRINEDFVVPRGTLVIVDNCRQELRDLKWEESLRTVRLAR